MRFQKNYIVFAACLLTVGTLFAKAEMKMKGDIVVVAPLNGVQVMPETCILDSGTVVIGHVFYSAGKEKARQTGRDPDLWGMRSGAMERWCQKYHLVLSAIYEHEGRSGERGVVLVKAFDHNKALTTLNDGLSAEIRNATKADSILYSLIAEQKKPVKAFWGYVEKDRITLGVGANYILIGPNEFFVPTVSLAYSRGMLGVEGEIGGGRAGNINSEKTLNGVWGANIFIRPCQFLKLGVGYQGTSRFFESDFTWDNRDDCFLGKAELEIPLSKKLSTNFTLGSLKAYDWGCYSRLSLSFNW